MKLIDFDRKIIEKLNEGDLFAFIENKVYCKPEFENWFLSTIKEVDFEDGLSNDDINFDFTFIQIENNKFGICIFFLNKEQERISKENRIGVLEGYDSTPLSLISARTPLSTEFFYVTNSWEEEFILVKNFLETFGFINKNVALPKTSIVSERHEFKIENNPDDVNRPFLHLTVIDYEMADSFVFEKKEVFEASEVFLKKKKTSNLIKVLGAIGVIVACAFLFFVI